MKRFCRLFLVLAMMLITTFAFGEASVNLLHVDTDCSYIAVYQLTRGYEASMSSYFIVFGTFAINDLPFFYPEIYVEQGSNFWKYDPIGLNTGVLMVMNPKWYEFYDTVNKNETIVYGLYLPFSFDRNEEFTVHIKESGKRFWHTFGSVDDEYSKKIYYMNDKVVYTEQ